MNSALAEEVNLNYSDASTLEAIFSEDERKKFQKKILSREQFPSTDRCSANLFFGFFFDGTRNNYERSGGNKTHSNVARLYDCYPGQSVPGVLSERTEWKYNAEIFAHFFRVYVPGVGSPFEAIDDDGTESRGAAMGYRCEDRITWALIQAINNVHRYFLKTILISHVEANSLIHGISLTNYQRDLMTALDRSKQDEGASSAPTSREIFEKLLKRLHDAVKQHWPDKRTGVPPKTDPGIVKTIFVSIFGFSRGATQARAFANWLVALCKLDASMTGRKATMSLGGFEIQFDFMGLFDTVASIGIANTFGNSTVLSGFDGHGSWADAEENLRVPDELPCLHLVAAQEVRRSFPLDSISLNGTFSAQAREVVFPGMHSDLGGGYMPLEQGKGTDPDGADMLSRIPLIYMYREARLAGVPLKLEYASEVAKKRFEVAPTTIAAFNAYLATCATKTGSVTELMREQRKYYIQWHLLRRPSGQSPLPGIASFARASTFDQNDLRSANIEFDVEIKAYEEWLKKKGDKFKPVAQRPGFGNEHESEWEEMSTWWKTAQPLHPDAVAFFDNYVHDSRAWFKVVPGNPDSEEAMRVMLAEWVQKRELARAYNANIDKMAPRLQARGRAADNLPIYGNSGYQHLSDGLSEEERQAADEFARTNEIPTMLTRGREPFDGEAKLFFLSAKAGYLRYRKVYAGGDKLLISSVHSRPNRAAA